MSAALCAFILLSSALCRLRVVSGLIYTPTNVHLTSHNMDLVLRWDPPDPASGLLFTSQYRSSVSEYKVGCVNISTLECDLTRLNVSIFQFGTYTGRVRAESRTEHSAWVESNEITLDRDTIISSPNVSLFSNGVTIEVEIKDPVLRISSLRNVYDRTIYRITHWKDGQNEKNRSFDVQQKRVVLNKLDPWTKYCVQVQITVRAPSKPSAAVCESTTREEVAPWVAAVVIISLLTVVVTLVVAVVVNRKRLSHFLWPEDVLPQHFKEDLLANHKSSMYLAMHNSCPPKEIYHPVSIIADSRTTGSAPLP